MSQHSRRKWTSGKKVTLGVSALAASGLAVGLLVTPSATAGETGAAEALEQSRAAAADAAAAKDAAPKARTLAASTADATVVSGITVNGGNSARVGTTNTQTITVKWTVSGGSTLYGSHAAIWRGTDQDSGLKQYMLSEQFEADTDPCIQSADTTFSCTATFKIDPQSDLTNEDAGAWKIELYAVTDATTDVDTDNAMTWHLKRWSRLSNNAAPEPVAKGKTITITGTLERANWDTHKYAGYTQQTVRLQERSLTGSYATTSSHLTGTGSLAGVEKQTRTATSDRCYRYKFEGTSTTPPVTATGDCVDVR
ncbi:calcium-binding protein [Streptomyces cavernicola]|uniref:Calcium-binding protein n=1 Tax=Streptomyces cavernicola TaxID=3043613 RepID=A0ABT6S784_9ACTN|nr:calcium-binding protein [Streptomyces sp. B-S-A6]MDI3403181.1 calcium-binding protein [Streptomyces sp. B-S-A6]